MGSARDLLLRQITAADRHGRFRLYHPVNQAGEPIYVHAKVLIVDDRLLRIGSSNLNNRSLGFDSECDLALEARTTEHRAAIARLRHELVAEHLDLPPRQVAATETGLGSLIATIERLRTPHGRSLRPLQAEPVDPYAEVVVRARLADPERPKRAETRLEHAAKLALRHLPPGPLMGLTAGLALGGMAALASRAWRRSGRAGR